MISRARRGQRGFVLITMALVAFGLMGAIGLSVDMGRVFISKNETQAFCDAAAISAALQLDGTITGIQRARNVVSNSTNSWNMNTTSVSNFTTEFATAIGGPWLESPNPATNYTLARVRATVPVRLYFLPGVVNQNSQDVVSMAVAGQVPVTTYGKGLGPFTAVAPDPTAPQLGLVIGDQYDIQWPAYNSSRHGCNAANPDNCFVQPTCSGEPRVSKAAVAENWGASVNGYWGETSSSIIRQEILDLAQAHPLSLNQVFPMEAGNRNAEGLALDERVNQDYDTVNNNPTAYQNNPNHNGRRLIPLPIVTPIAGQQSRVEGFGAFLLITNGTPSNYYRNGNGNDPFCAIYAGPYILGSNNTGGSGQTGSYRIQLLQ